MLSGAEISCKGCIDQHGFHYCYQSMKSWEHYEYLLSVVVKVTPEEKILGWFLLLHVGISTVYLLFGFFKVTTSLHISKIKSVNQSTAV